MNRNLRIKIRRITNGTEAELFLICGRQIAKTNSDMIWAKRTVKAKGAAVVLRLADFVDLVIE